MNYLSKPEMDALDFAIIERLQVDGRISLSELGRQVGLSQPAVSERVKRLEERQVIAGYTAVINPAALGLNMMAIIRLQTTHEHIRACLDCFRKMPHVLSIYRVTGEDCFVLRVIVPSPEALEPIVDSIARFGAVKTAIVLRNEPEKPLVKATTSEWTTPLLRTLE